VAREFGKILKKIKILELLSKKYQENIKKKKCGYLKKIGSGNNGGIKFLPNIYKGYSSKIIFSKISFGGKFLVALTPDGKVYTVGSSSFGQLGHGDKKSSDDLIQVKNLPKIKHISAGYSYISVISTKGAIYSWGAGQDGRLGNNSEDDICSPVRIDTDWIAERIETGSVHSVAISKNNKLYSWGFSKYNGHNEEENTLFPKMIDSIKHILFHKISIGYGGYHTLALSYAGNLYSWGHNRVGQLGSSNANCIRNNNNDNNTFYNPVPSICESLLGIPIFDISAGWGHSAVISVNNKIYMCGRNFRGQIGVDPKICQINERGHPCLFNFTLMNNLPYQQKIVKIFCGGEHTIALTDNGNFISWGCNEFSQLGYSDEKNYSFIPKIIEKEELSHYFDLALGANVTFILDSNISMLTFN